MYTRWNTYTSFLKARYGSSVYRIGVDGGFSCPNRMKDRSGGCAFCDGTGAIAAYQRSLESSFTRSSLFDSSVSSSVIQRSDSIRSQIEKGREFLVKRYKAEKFLLYFQSWTNTYDSVENLKRIYDAALSVMPFAGLVVSTRPDSVPEPVLRLLEGYRKDLDVYLELGLQSSNDSTLRRIGRGHDAACYLDAAKRCHSHGLEISTHVILGLPGEGRDDFISTIRTVNRARSEAIKIHNLHVAGGTRLYNDYLEGLFTVSSEARHLENTEMALRHLDPGIVVQRLVCDTPMHRLAAPRHFPDKSLFLSHLQQRMEKNGTMQGDLYIEA